MAVHDINRSTTGVYLPPEISNEIWTKTQEASAVMQLATQMPMAGSGVTVKMITGDPVANWVGETGTIGTSKGTLAKKEITPYKMGVIIPFSYEYLRDDNRMYEELIARVPGVFAEKFDGTVFGKYNKPGTNFDQLSGCAGVDIKSDPWAGLVSADRLIAENNADINGYCLSPKARSLFLGAKDGNGRPLFVDSVAQGNIPMLLGNPTYRSKGVYLAGEKSSNKPEQLGIAGDWTSARFGMVDGMRIFIATQGTLPGTENSEEINLLTDEMVAVRFTMEIAFGVKDTNDFVKLTGEIPAQ